MKELGIDISEHRSKDVKEFEGQRFDYVITVCDNAKESCPLFTGAVKRLHQGFGDPPVASWGQMKTASPFFAACGTSCEPISASLLSGSGDLCKTGVVVSLKAIAP
jgi:hypothetical protein